jgi:prepilin-type N-terminal cleavage/methylation domain-containing protein
MNMHNCLKFRVGGFSLIEMLIVVMFLGILAAVAVPRFSMAAVYTKRDQAFVRKLMTDLRKTRQMAVANAADNSSGFQLRINTASPRSYEIRNLQNNQVVETFPVDSRITFSGTTRFSFTSLGTLNPVTTVQMTITGQKRWVFDVYGYTGSVKCTEQ